MGTVTFLFTRQDLARCINIIDMIDPLRIKSVNTFRESYCKDY